ncbi:MAG: STY4528 family pathogenicity island replication protein [Pseudomonadota bacterium]|nr:STY4528 family pathogenicity island replication protein [Pseudomonadota bacterium]
MLAGDRPPPSDMDAISPRTLALQALIDASIDALEQIDRPTNAEALLFIGNWNDALPRLLIHDPVLEPVDKIVWAVIKTCTDPRRGTAFPNYATIARLANVSAEGTITRALAILRVTRWLSLCGRARDRRGRFRGSVYALHDEPLPLSDALHLDPEYLAFTHRSTSHSHARVALVASGVLRSLELDVAEKKSMESESDPMTQRIEAQRLIRHREDQASPGSSNSATRRAAFSRSFATRFELLPEPTDVQSHPPDQPQILGSVLPRLLDNLRAGHQPQNLSPPPDPHGGSSSKKIKTTTTTPEVVVKTAIAENGSRRQGAEPADDPELALQRYRWPDWLGTNARHLALMELRRAPLALRQTVLDLLDQRQHDAAAGIADRLRHPIQYLRSLCQLAAAGRIEALTPSQPFETPAEQRAPLLQQLQEAESDLRHWLRLIELAGDKHRKAEWQAEANRAQAEASRCRTALAALGNGNA